MTAKNKKTAPGRVNITEVEHFVDTFLLPGFEVSQVGRVRNKKTGRVLNPKMEADGYLSVTVQVPVHALVAYAFEPNPDPENLLYIRHKDGVRTNNFYLNLEFSADDPDVEAPKMEHPVRAKSASVSNIITVETESALLKEVAEWVKDMTTGAKVEEATGEFTHQITYPKGPGVGISLPPDQVELLKRHVQFPASKKALKGLEASILKGKLKALIE